jgi:putative transposase
MITDRITPFFDYSPEVWQIIYTTNAIESVNMSLRKITKNRGSFPSDDALFKLFYLVLNNIAKKWTMPVKNWKPVLNRFTIQFGEMMRRIDTRPVYTKFGTLSSNGTTKPIFL